MIIRQRNHTDCGICSLAMATNNNYENVAKVFDSKAGVLLEEASIYLLERGLPSIYLITDAYLRATEAPDFNKRYAWSEMQLKQYLRGRRAVINVQAGDSYHCVYWDGFYVLDPARNEPQQLERYTLLGALVIDQHRNVMFENNNNDLQKIREFRF
ncbi:TPA: hypothetical protein NGS33_003394 [Vibrio parahaemolyticus]|uniref:hypothetical protein n=1 Tax=Vibrio parahaemolyticus TaxID=670 RepID=UPI001121921E|nr:hypothetical protein [Vibrio parahaemolyticus]TPA81862.1 hypothetical protein DXJ87_21840 [Vibrio parahaemolyticus]HCE1745693.1 hypothetical protein [Vibrio parahaemolyticus]